MLTHSNKKGAIQQHCHFNISLLEVVDLVWYFLWLKLLTVSSIQDKTDGFFIWCLVLFAQISWALHHSIAFVFISLINFKKNKFTYIFINLLIHYDFQILENIPQLLNVFLNKDEILSNILLPLLSTKHNNVQQKIAEVLPIILCTSSSDYIKLLTPDAIKVICKKCNVKFDDDELTLDEYKKGDGHCLGVTFSKNRVDLSSLMMVFVKTIINYLIITNEELRIKAIYSMPSLSQHITKFYSPDIVKIWIELTGHSKLEIRKSLIDVIRATIENGQVKSNEGYK